MLEISASTENVVEPPSLLVKTKFILYFQKLPTDQVGNSASFNKTGSFLLYATLFDSMLLIEIALTKQLAVIKKTKKIDVIYPTFSIYTPYL
jgi:hypothetical protein